MRQVLLRSLGPLYTLALLLCGLLVVLLEVPIEIDATPYKDRLLTLVEEGTGLAVQVDGDIRLTTGPTAGLVVDGLRVSNPTLSGTGPLLSAECLALRVQTADLLSGTLKPLLLRVERGTVVLERDKDGRGSWQTPAGDAAGIGPPTLDPSAFVTDGLELEIEDSRLSYIDRQHGTEVQVVLTRAIAKPSGDQLRLELAGTVNGRPVRLTGETTTLSQLLAAGSAVPIRLSGDLLGLRVEVDGSVPPPGNDESGTLRLDLSGDSLEGLAPWLDKRLPLDQPVRASLTLTGGGGRYRIDAPSLRLGGRRLSFDGDLTLVERGELRVSDAEVEYQDGKEGGTWRIGIDSARLSPAGDALDFGVDGRVSGLGVSAHGTLDHRARKPSLRAKVEVSGDSLAGLEPWIGADLARLARVSARFDLAVDRQVYRLAPTELRVGENRLDGRVVLDLSGDRPQIDLDLGSDFLDLGPLLATVPAGPGDGGQARGMVFSDAPLALGWMDVLDVRARVHALRLISPPVNWDDAELKVRSDAARLHLDFGGNVVGARRVSATLDLDTGREPMAATLGLTGNRLLIAPMIANSEAAGMIEGDLDLSVSLAGRGASVHALVSTLNGKVVLLVEHAEADLSDLDRLTPGVRNLLGQLGRRESKMARVECAVAVIQPADGRADVNVLIDSQDSLVVADGTVDLGAETLRIQVVPSAKGVVNLRVAAPVLIEGALASPRYSVEKAGLLASVAELVSRIAVPQLLLVDALGQAAADNRCVRIVTGREQPTGLGGPVQAATRPIKAAVKGAGKVIEGVGGAVIDGAGAVLKGIDGAVNGITGGDRTTPEDSPGPFLDR